MSSRRPSPFLGVLLAGLGALSSGCAQARLDEKGPERLDAWAQGPVRDRILAFVDAVVDPASAAFVPPAERIAVFDLDGTLVVERPLHIEVLTAVAALRAAVASDPSLAEVEPYRSVVAGDDDFVRANGGAIVTAAAGHSGTLAAFHESVRDTYARAHPTLGRPYSALFYRPMLQLIGLLQSNDFEVYVVSQSQQEYIRAFAAPCLGLDPANVIGSTYAFSMEGDGFLRTSELWEPYNRGEGKVLRIRERTGRLPILAVGNGAGDRGFLESAERAATHLALYLSHDDGEREFAYVDDEMLRLARERGWEVVSMKDDFAELFRDDCLL